MAALVGEDEDLRTCSICFNEYNEDAHKPKYLDCHHTFCIQCIKVKGNAFLAIDYKVKLFLFVVFSQSQKSF